MRLLDFRHDRLERSASRTSFSLLELPLDLSRTVNYFRCLRQLQSPELAIDYRFEISGLDKDPYWNLTGLIRSQLGVFYPVLLDALERYFHVVR